MPVSRDSALSGHRRVSRSTPTWLSLACAVGALGATLGIARWIRSRGDSQAEAAASELIERMDQYEGEIEEELVGERDPPLDTAEWQDYRLEVRLRDQVAQQALLGGATSLVVGQIPLALPAPSNPPSVSPTPLKPPAAMRAVNKARRQIHHVRKVVGVGPLGVKQWAKVLVEGPATGSKLVEALAHHCKALYPSIAHVRSEANEIVVRRVLANIRGDYSIRDGDFNRICPLVVEAFFLPLKEDILASRIRRTHAVTKRIQEERGNPLGIWWKVLSRGGGGGER